MVAHDHEPDRLSEKRKATAIITRVLCRDNIDIRTSRHFSSFDYRCYTLIWTQVTRAGVYGKLTFERDLHVGSTRRSGGLIRNKGGDRA